jgi:polyhydroxybutyrate depolymerase
VPPPAIRSWHGRALWRCKLRLLALLLALAAAHGLAGCRGTPPPPVPSATHRDFSFQREQDGVRRTVLVHLPAGWQPGGRWPLVLALHGGGGQPQGMREITGLDAAADAHGFIALYPEGYPRRVFGRRFATWNAGRCCGDAVEHHSEDVGFLLALVDAAIRDYGADPRRVYVTGFSNGAQMAYRLACERPGRIAAIAPVAAQGVLDDCPPGRAVPVLHIHGTDDRCTPYAGGTCGGCFARVVKRLTGLPASSPEWQCDPVQQHLRERARRAGLGGEPHRISTHGAAHCEGWGPAADGAEVVLCTVEGGGHAWPGGSQGPVCHDPESRACRIFREELGEVSHDLAASETIWAFFSRHTLP